MLGVGDNGDERVKKGDSGRRRRRRRRRMKKEKIVWLVGFLTSGRRQQLGDLVDGSQD